MKAAKTENSKIDASDYNYVFDFRREETYDLGARLLTILACPPDTSDTDEMRGKFHAVLCHEAIKERSRQDPAWANMPHLIRPVYMFRNPKTALRDMKNLDRRLRDRLVAARMAIGFLQKAETGKTPALPPEVKRLSLNEISEHVRKDANQSEATNVQTRIWRPSRPVIHLAAALAVNMNLVEQVHKKESSFGDIIFSRETIEWIVIEAEKYEHLLTKSGLNIDLQRLVRIRLAS